MTMPSGPRAGGSPLIRSAISPSIVLPDGRILIDSYHCSRYNQNTGRLTAAMFEAVFARALDVQELKMQTYFGASPPRRRASLRPHRSRASPTGRGMPPA